MSGKKERVISADSHVTVTQEKVKEHLDRRYHDEYDRAVATFDHRILNEATAKANREGMREYTHPAFGRPGVHDPIARIKDMDEDSVDCEVLYCELSAFRYLYLMREGWQDATRAFNDALYEFESADPRRLVMSYQVPIHNVDFAVEEVTRLAERGARSLQLPVFPREVGQPDYPHETYRPLWERLESLGLPVCLHVGINRSLDELAGRDPTADGSIWKPMVPLLTAEAFGFWVMTGLLDRYPDMKVVFVESGIGWVPYYIDFMDDWATRQQRDTREIRELPSYYFEKNISLTFINEPKAIKAVGEWIGFDNIMWSSDYPHPISSWPSSQQIIEESLASVSEADRRMLLSGNAERVWGI